MRHGSLFSGIGGFDLAAEWMGWDNVFHCEWAEFPRKILEHYWPDADSYGDITKTDFNVYRGTIDILTGGFPCQPYSQAGKRKGKDDDRHLWPHMLRAIREIKPRWVVGENVFGLTNWNGGVVLEEVCAELEAEGYSVQPFIIPAAAVGAPHRRDRVWIVAYSNGLRRREEYDVQQAKLHIKYGKDGFVANADMHGCNECDGNDEVNTGQGRQYAQRDAKQGNEHGYSANTGSERLQGGIQAGINAEQNGHIRSIKAIGQHLSSDGSRIQFQDFPTQSPICGGNDGVPTELDGITVSKWRRESIKGYGNAIVPQVAFQIFEAIQKMEDTWTH